MGKLKLLGRCVQEIPEKFCQSNVMINSQRGFDIERYSVDVPMRFGVFDLRLFFFALSLVTPRLPNSREYDTEFRELIVPNEILKEKLCVWDSGRAGNIEGSFFRELRKSAQKLFGMTVAMDFVKKSGRKGFALYHVFSKMYYDPDDGLHMQFDEGVLPFVLNLVDYHYTVFTFDEIIKLTSSAHAIRLYELLMQYRNMKVKERFFSLDEVRRYFDIPNGSYSRVTDLRKHVFEKPIEEINRKTNMNIDPLEVVKTGKFVEGFKVKFSFSPEEKKEEDAAPKPVSREVYRTMLSAGIPLRMANRFRALYDDYRILSNIILVRHRIKTGRTKIENATGLYITAIKQDYVTRNRESKWRKNREEVRDIPTREAVMAADHGNFRQDMVAIAHGYQNWAEYEAKVVREEAEKYSSPV